MSNTQDKIEKLHEIAMSMTANELIKTLAEALDNEKINPKGILILKMYLCRALNREGVK
jgi:hypothetical protein